MKHRKSKSSRARVRFRLWLAELDHGDSARRGILITDDAAMPRPLAWIDGYGPAARHAAERVFAGEPIAEWCDSDLRETGTDRCAEMLDGNLMFPMRPFSDTLIDESDPNLAAARYTADVRGFARFSIFSWTGLQSLLMDIPVIYSGPSLEKAMTSFERGERERQAKADQLRDAELAETRRKRLVAEASPLIFGNHKKKPGAK